MGGVDGADSQNHLSNTAYRNDHHHHHHYHHHHHRANDEMNGQPRFKSANKALDKEKCATKIQAGIRGFLVRKKQRVAADAAVKIQAGFRGFRARKQLKNLKEWWWWRSSNSNSNSKQNKT